MHQKKGAGTIADPGEPAGQSCCGGGIQMKGEPGQTDVGRAVNHLEIY